MRYLEMNKNPVGHFLENTTRTNAARMVVYVTGLNTINEEFSYFAKVIHPGEADIETGGFITSDFDYYDWDFVDDQYDIRSPE